MLKKIGIRIGILTAVFVVAVIIFSRLLNQGQADMNVAMEKATLPGVSFMTEGYEVNTLAGHVTNMEIPSMRDTITLVKDNTLIMRIKAYEEEIKSITWQVYSMDGENCLQKETLDSAEICEMHFNDNGMLDTEKVLKVTLHLEDKDVYYYTRIKELEGDNYTSCLEFVRNFQEDALNKQDPEALGQYLETAYGGDADGFHKVTLASSLDYVTWGSLEPELSDTVSWQIKEHNDTYTSILLSYQVQCAGLDENADQMYEVKEFFRVRLYNEKMYLMDYERNMEQIFAAGQETLDENGIRAGIASGDLEYEHNENGSVVAFVQNRALWSYNKETDTFSLLFSFVDAEKDDSRNHYDHHEIHIDSIDENGNVLFYVLGYMNRGKHEGEVGVAIYSFDAEKGAIAEKAFVPSQKGYWVMKEDLGQFIHYSTKEGLLYVMVDGYLYRVNLEEDTKELLVRGMEDAQYAVSENGSLLLYQKTETGKAYSHKMIFLNLETGNSFEIENPNGEYIRPIGFINSDLVYGTMRQEDEGQSFTGESILPMYKLSIMNQEQKIVKEYQVDGVYIQKVNISENVLELQRVTKNETSYSVTAADYITSNEQGAQSSIVISSYTDGVRGKSQRIQFSDEIGSEGVAVSKPKFVLQEKIPNVKFDEAKMQGRFYVYALGSMQGAYDHAGEAIRHANNLNGVVVSSRQAYVWERGNWPTADEIEGVAPFVAAEGQSTVEACVAKIIEKEGYSADISSELAAGKTLVSILSEYSGGEGMDLTGCTMDELQYTISRETPVIAMIGENNAVLLTGYNKTNIAYIDPVSGENKIVTKETIMTNTMCVSYPWKIAEA